MVYEFRKRWSLLIQYNTSHVGSANVWYRYIPRWRLHIPAWRRSLHATGWRQWFSFSIIILNNNFYYKTVTYFVPSVACNRSNWCALSRHIVITSIRYFRLCILHYMLHLQSCTGMQYPLIFYVMELSLPHFIIHIISVHFNSEAVFSHKGSKNFIESYDIIFAQWH